MIKDIAFGLFILLICTCLLPINGYGRQRAKKHDKANKISGVIEP